MTEYGKTIILSELKYCFRSSDLCDEALSQCKQAGIYPYTGRRLWKTILGVLALYFGNNYL